MTPRIIVIGTSLGGLNALTVLLRRLPASLPVPIAVVQHRGTGDDGALAELLNQTSELRVVDAEDKMPIAPGHVYLAPPDYHLLVEADGTLALSTDAHVRSARPSIDVLFESAAQAFGPRAIAVVLTGASADGADGLRSIKEKGGLAIVEDPSTAECAIMPAAALAAAPVASVLPLNRIPDYLTALVDGARV
jgi:two-component system, chemotaxis family, protein-glutamate methylesterase/glutaminase